MDNVIAIGIPVVSDYMLGRKQYDQKEKVLVFYLLQNMCFML